MIMAKAPGNFNQDIHVSDYRSRYDGSRVTSSSLISIEGRATESLNGKWNFTVDPYETFLRANWYNAPEYTADGRQLPVDFDFPNMDFMKVPSCWNMERPELFYYENMGIYYRTFRYEKADNDERLFLCFEGVSYRAYVFLNGKYIAMHDGASTPFDVEITELVQRDNTLLVAVDASRNDLRVPMSNTDWFNYGGIYRDVFLLRCPKVFIKDWFVRLQPGTSFKKIAVDFEIDGTASGIASFEIPELGIHKEITFENGRGGIVFDADVSLWSPENPKLYDVRLSACGDELCDKIGFREFKVVGNSIFLNGEERFLKGVSVHEDHYLLGKTTNESVIRDTIRLVKDELNGCFIRVAHYPHTRAFARIADEMGILLWEEIPVYWAISFASDKTYSDAENQIAELIRRDKNRASVVVWSVGNENADTDDRFRFMSSLASFVHSVDPTRAVSAACLINEVDLKIEDRLAACLDIIGINEYYGWYKPDFTELGRILENSNPDKPVIITEFGADARSGFHGTKNMLWCEEFQEELYKKQVKEISSCRYIKGMTPWILYDFRAARRQNTYQEGFNRKGLVDADRKTKKLAFHVLSKFYSTIK